MGSRYDDELWELVPDDPGPPPAHLVGFVRALGPVERALDLGCGDGRLTAELDAARADAADVSAVALERARARLAGATRSSSSRTRRCRSPDGAFELVLRAETIEHVRDVQLFLSETRRVLRPGGELALTTPASAAAVRPGDPLSPHLRRFTRGSLRARARRARLRRRVAAPPLGHAAGACATALAAARPAAARAGAAAPASRKSRAVALEIAGRGRSPPWTVVGGLTGWSSVPSWKAARRYQVWGSPGNLSTACSSVSRAAATLAGLGLDRRPVKQRLGAERVRVGRVLGLGDRRLGLPGVDSSSASPVCPVGGLGLPDRPGGEQRGQQHRAAGEQSRGRERQRLARARVAARAGRSGPAPGHEARGHERHRGRARARTRSSRSPTAGRTRPPSAPSATSAIAVAVPVAPRPVAVARAPTAAGAGAAPWRARRPPARRPAARVLSATPDDAEVGERLGHEAVGVAGHAVVVAIAQPGAREGAGARADRGPVLEHPARLAPVLAARGGRRRSARPAPSRSGAVLVSLVSSSTRSPIVPLSHRGEARPAGRRTRPRRRRCPSGGRAQRREAAAQAGVHGDAGHRAGPATISTSSRPNSPATLSFTAQRLGGSRRRRPSTAPRPPRAPAPSDGQQDHGQRCAAAAARSRARRRRRPPPPPARRATASAGSPAPRRPSPG